MESFSNTKLFLESHLVDVEAFDFTGLLTNLQLDGYQVLGEGRRLETNASEITVNLLMAIFCVICAGLASGLTQGLLSLDIMDMRIKAQSGTPKERECAAKVLPIIQNHHLLLVTLMLWNASAAEALPVFLDKIVPEFVAVIISVTLVLLFGEILPSSLLTGPKQLEIAAALSPLVYLAYGIFFPVAYPIAKLLDCFIGHDEGMTVYTRAEIKTMLNLMYEEASKLIFRSAETRNPLGQQSFSSASMKNKTASHIKKDELDIIDGALRFRDVHVCDVMTPLDNVFAISLHEVLSYETLEYISKAGFSKIPVFDGKKQDIVGLVYTKDLMFVDPEENVSVKEIVKLHGHKLLSFWYDENLSDVLSIFRREEEEIAFVRDVFQEDELKDPIYCIRGIVTVEDIIEEIFGRKLWNLSLSDWEVQMISDYIMKNVPQIERYYERKIIPTLSLSSTLSFDKYSFLSSRLYDLVKQSEVCFMKRSTTQSISKPLVTAPHSNPSASHSTLFTALTKISSYSFNGSNNTKSIVDYAEDDVIIRSGRFLDHYIVVLQGQVKLIYDDVAHSEEIFGPWSVIGADVLISGANTYSPHFTVIIHSRQVKFIRIKPFKIIKQQSSEESSGATYLHTIAEEGSEDRDDTHVPPLLPSSPPLNAKKSSIISNPLLLRFQLNYRHKQSSRSAHAMSLDSYQLKDKYPATPNTLFITNSEKKATARKISPINIKSSEKESLVPLLKVTNPTINDNEEEDLEWNGDHSHDGTQASSLLSMKRLSKERKKNKTIQQHGEEEWTILNPIVEDSNHNDNDIIL